MLYLDIIDILVRLGVMGLRQRAELSFKCWFYLAENASQISTPLILILHLCHTSAEEYHHCDLTVMRLEPGQWRNGRARHDI